MGDRPLVWVMQHGQDLLAQMLAQPLGAGQAILEWLPVVLERLAGGSLERQRAVSGPER